MLARVATLLGDGGYYIPLDKSVKPIGSIERSEREDLNAVAEL